MSNTSSYYQSLRHEVVALLPKHYSRVLEIGCGAGRFRENLNQEHEYWGIEPVESMAKIASSNLSKGLIGTYKEVFSQIPDGYFEVWVPFLDHKLAEFCATISSEMKVRVWDPEYL